MERGMKFQRIGRSRKIEALMEYEKEERDKRRKDIKL